jgi:hypothetical protein
MHAWIGLFLAAKTSKITRVLHSHTHAHAHTHIHTYTNRSFSGNNGDGSGNGQGEGGGGIPEPPPVPHPCIGRLCRPLHERKWKIPVWFHDVHYNGEHARVCI